MAENKIYSPTRFASFDHKRLSQMLPETEHLERREAARPAGPTQQGFTRVRSRSDPGQPDGIIARACADMDPSQPGTVAPTTFLSLKTEAKSIDVESLPAKKVDRRERSKSPNRMAPLARDKEIAVNDDVLFHKYRGEALLCTEQPSENGEASTGSGDTVITVEETQTPAPHSRKSPATTFRGKIMAITHALRSRKTVQVPGKKITWRSKVLAMTNLISLSRVASDASSPADGVQSADGSARRKTNRSKRRKPSSMTIDSQAGNGLMVRSALLKNNRDLMDIVSRQDESAGKIPTMSALKLLLSSDKTTHELIELAYEPRRLHGELKVLLHKHAKEEKKRIAMEEADAKQRSQQKRKGQQRRRASIAQYEMQLHQEEQIRKRELGYGMPKDAFTQLVDCQNKMAGNQMAVARLMQALVDLNKEGQPKKWNLWCLRWYKCLDPDSWIISAWTVVYMLLILHITTAGLFNIAFNEDFRPSAAAAPTVEDCSNVEFSAYQWFDAAVDLFFIVDILCRLLLFGQIKESKTAMGAQSKMEVIVDPEEVLRTYVRNGLAVDLATGIPIQWISMALEAACFTNNSSPLLLARCLRIFRITRVVKLFRTYKVKMWMRRLKRVTGNTSIMQMMHLVLGLAFLNHVWTCLSWIIQSLDEEGFEEFTDRLGIKASSPNWAQYSIMFMNTLQIVFAIEPYRGDTTLEAWFGSLTLALSVFISATMLSKILEIWQMANEAQTQRDSRINTVMQFTARNGIATDLRNEVLDYFEFRYSNPAADFEKRFLDDLPTEMQARVISQMFPGALDKSTLFTGTSEMFISQLIVKIARRPVPTMPQQVIIAQGAFGSEMFLLKSGTVEVSTVDEEGQQTHVKTLGPGSTFGDLSMWMDSRHNATVTSLEFCQLHMLTRHDLEDTLQSFPEISHVIASQALAHCLRAPVLARALEGISLSASERMGRRMAHHRVEFEPGEALYLEAEEAETAYVIRKGKVEVELLEGRLEGLEDVRCIGFDALLSCRCYQETVRARETVVAYSISANDIVELFARDKDLLEERERVAELHYKRATAQLLDLRWMLLSQDLLARHKSALTGTQHGPDMNLASTQSLDSWEESSRGLPVGHGRSGLAEQLVHYLRADVEPALPPPPMLTAIRVES